MKKLLSLIMLSLLIFSGYVSARCIYDSTGRHLIYDDTIRGRRKAKALAKQQKAFQVAAAAKITEEEETKTPAKKSNYIQSPLGRMYQLPDSNLKSNYVQSKIK